MKYRMVSIQEVQECPAHRLDPQHYLPHHKTGECFKSRMPKKPSLLVLAKNVVEAWCKVPTRCIQCMHHLDRYEKWDEMERAVDALDKELVDRDIKAKLKLEERGT